MSAAHYNLKVNIPRGNGTREGRIRYTGSNKAETGLIVCPPHPLLAGNIDNNVVTAIAQTVAQKIPVLLLTTEESAKAGHPGRSSRFSNIGRKLTGQMTIPR